MSKQVRSDTKKALQRALKSQPGEKESKWTASDEAAAMGGVIDFLQNYMKRDGKFFVKAGDKHKGAAAQLAFTALEFANKCGGVEMSFHMDKVAAADDDEDEEEDAAAPAAAAPKYNKEQVDAHDHALDATLLKGEKLWGRIKYLEEYKLKYYYEDEIKKLEATRDEYDGDNKGIKQMLQQSVDDTKKADKKDIDKEVRMTYSFFYVLLSCLYARFFSWFVR